MCFIKRVRTRRYFIFFYESFANIKIYIKFKKVFFFQNVYLTGSGSDIFFKIGVDFKNTAQHQTLKFNLHKNSIKKEYTFYARSSSQNEAKMWKLISLDCFLKNLIKYHLLKNGVIN